MSRATGSRTWARRAPGILAAGAVLLLAGLLSWQGTALAGWENDFYALVWDEVGSATSDELRSCSDEQGGMIVAVVDDFASPPVWLSRVDHVGNEVWGQGGTFIPFTVSADDQTGPMDVAPDGMGGAYCAFREIWGTNHYLVVAHLLPDGSYDWLCYVADIGNPSDTMYPWVVLETTGDGEVIVGWLNAVLGDEKVIVARVSSYGTVLWQTPIAPGVWTDWFQVNWTMASDGQGGALLCYSHLQIGQPLTAYVQRVSGAGTLLWGANGQALDTNYFYGVCPIVRDAGGGAWIAQEDIVQNNTRVMHFDASGNESWTGGGLVAMPYETRPVLCEDGGGGIFLATTFDPGGQNHDVVVQHVDAWGGLIWGASGITVADQAGGQVNPRICSDGFGGVLLGYEDWYFVEIGGSDNRVPSGARLDAFGTVLWERSGLWFDGMGDGLEPSEVVPIADGSGGALYNWSECHSNFHTDEVYALGVSATGENPKPVLTYLYPDAGVPGEILPVYILGDYLEAEQSFKLQRAGASDLPITGNVFINNQLIEGSLDLSGAELGGYDLSVSVASVPADTLADAFGVGEPPACEGDEPFETHPAQALSAGSQRKAAFGPDGKAHLAWIEYVDPNYRVYKWTGDGDSEWHVMRYEYPAVTRDLSLAVGADGMANYCFVVEDGGEERLYYYRENVEGAVEFTVTGAIMDGIDNPAIAVDTAGTVHVVYEGDIMGESWLFHMTVDEEGFHGPWDMISGAGAREPDLTAYGDGLMVTYVRDFWFPGLREVCYQQAESDEWGWIWDNPAGYYWGLYVSSPSVAWDGGDELLFSFILDNTGSAPLLHTALMESELLGPVRWRFTSDLIYRCSVAAAGPGLYYLLTQESGTGIPMEVYLRSGDGKVFYPKRRLNSHDDVDLPFFAVEHGGQGLFAFWEDYEIEFPFSRYLCFGGTAAPGETAPAAAGPNPFNPSTTIALALPEAGWTKLALYDVSGRRVRTLLDGQTSAGTHQLVWDGRNDKGTALPSGIYFARLVLPGGHGEKVNKLTLLK